MKKLTTLFTVLITLMLTISCANEVKANSVWTCYKNTTAGVSLIIQKGNKWQLNCFEDGKEGYLYKGTYNGKLKSGKTCEAYLTHQNTAEDGFTNCEWTEVDAEAQSQKFANFIYDGEILKVEGYEDGKIVEVLEFKPE